MTGDFARELRAGWQRAAVAQQNVAWARALLGVVGAGRRSASERAAVRPSKQRTRSECSTRVDAGDSLVLPMLAAVDGPWPAELATVVVGYVERLMATGLVRESTGLLQLVARRLPVRTPFTVQTIQARATAEDWADQQARSAGFDHPWRRALTVLSATLSVRARVDDELRRSAP